MNEKSGGRELDVAALTDGIGQALAAVLDAAGATDEESRSVLAASVLHAAGAAHGGTASPRAAARELAVAHRLVSRARRRLAAASSASTEPVVADEWDPLHRALRVGAVALHARDEVVGVGLSMRRRSGVSTGEPCVAVYVSRKRSPRALARAGITMLPAALEVPGGGTVPVDVVEVGRLRRTGVCGTALGPDGSHEFGTLGVVARDRGSGATVVLTAGHLAMGLAPGARFDAPPPGQAASRPLGRLLRSTTDGVDAAAVEMDEPPPVEAFIRGIGVPAGPRAVAVPADLNHEVRFCGAKSGFRAGILEHALVDIPDENLRNVMLVRVLVAPGDSGAAVVDHDGHVLGLLVGHFSAAPDLSVVTPIGAVLDALQCTL